MPFQPLDPSLAQVVAPLSLGVPLTSVGETLATLRTELGLMLGERGDIDSDRMDRWINWGYRTLCQSLDLAELDGSFGLTTVADQPFYLLPDQVEWVKKISHLDVVNYAEGGRELDLIDESAFRKLDETTVFGTDNLTLPAKWFPFNRMVVLWPRPQVSYDLSLDVKIRPGKLVAETDSPIIPEVWTEPLLLAAKVSALRALEDYVRADATWNHYNDERNQRTNTKAEAKTNQYAGIKFVGSTKRLYRRGR